LNIDGGKSLLVVLATDPVFTLLEAGRQTLPWNQIRAQLDESRAKSPNLQKWTLETDERDEGGDTPFHDNSHQYG
jgi:hypothetical protein